tara:strand:- start:1003 stop:1566 length:564 start_codon:yes stop_codon:yes gene_type:complete
MRIVGIDPGLRQTGWGMIDVDGNRLQHVANGVVGSVADDEFAQRLRQLFDGITETLELFQPVEAAVEETFVNRNPVSTLKLGQARGVVLLAPALKGMIVAEYPANLVKKSVVGVGHATKQQIHLMVKTLLGGANVESSDAADALAVAICHAHHRSTQRRWMPVRDRKPSRIRAKPLSVSVVSGDPLT